MIKKRLHRGHAYNSRVLKILQEKDVYSGKTSTEPLF